jgi:hypothetical protein
MAKKPLPLRIDEELLRRVDEARGDVPRTRFVERALEAALVPSVRYPPSFTIDSSVLKAAKEARTEAAEVHSREEEAAHSAAVRVETARQLVSAGPGACPKATCSLTGPLGDYCPDHANLRFKS